MYNLHNTNYRDLCNSTFWSVTDYCLSNPESDTYLLKIAKEDTKNRPSWFADLAREAQLALELSGNLDAPLP